MPRLAHPDLRSTSPTHHAAGSAANHLRAGLLALAAVALSLAPQQAQACGGCFSPVPPTGPTGGQYVVQNAERVVFTHNPVTNLTRVWVEVRYTGAAKDFGWVLPMPKAPTITVGTTVALDLIDGQTAPVFQLKTRNLENCREPRTGCVHLTPPQPDVVYSDASTAMDAGTSGGRHWGAECDGTQRRPNRTLRLCGARQQERDSPSILAHDARV